MGTKCSQHVLEGNCLIFLVHINEILNCGNSIYETIHEHHMGRNLVSARMLLEFFLFPFFSLFPLVYIYWLLLQENVMMKEQLQVLIQENALLKRAVTIQHERRKEFEDRGQELHNLKQMVSQYQEQLRTLEVSLPNSKEFYLFSFM